MTIDIGHSIGDEGDEILSETQKYKNGGSITYKYINNENEWRFFCHLSNFYIGKIQTFKIPILSTECSHMPKLFISRLSHFKENVI